MTKEKRQRKKKPPARRPKSKLLISEYLDDSSPTDLAEAMGLRFLNQGYEFLKPSFNPTLETLERIAEAINKLKGTQLSARDLISTE